MELLYFNGYIKADKLPQALHSAKIKGLMPGVDDRAIREFLQEFEEIKAQRHGEFQSQINLLEMEKIIQIIGRNHADHISDQQTQAIAEVLLNKDFQF